MKQTLLTRVIGFSAIALGVLTLAVNPRGRNGNEGTYLISCTAQKLYIDTPSWNDNGIEPGFYTSKALAQALMDRIIQNYRIQQAGNPFAFIGERGMEMARPEMAKTTAGIFNDLCRGRPLPPPPLINISVNKR